MYQGYKETIQTKQQVVNLKEILKLEDRFTSTLKYQQVQATVNTE